MSPTDQLVTKLATHRPTVDDVLHDIDDLERVFAHTDDKDVRDEIAAIIHHLEEIADTMPTN